MNKYKKCEFTITPHCILSITGKKSSSSLDISGNQINTTPSTSTDGITYNLTLEKNVTYYIYIEESSSTNSQYTVSVSQDNWVYAPNGAAVKYGVSYNLSNSITCLDFYITDKTIFEIIQYQLKNHNNGVGYDSPNIESYLASKDTLEKWEKSTAADSILIIDNLNEGYTEWNNLMNEIGTTASLMGLVTLVDKTGISGTVVTLLGAGSALSLQNDEEELAKALQDGKYNIRLATTYHKGTKVSIRYDYFESWNDKYYINKYATNGLYRNEFIQDIDIKKLYFDSNDKIWYYIDENGDKIYA